MTADRPLPPKAVRETAAYWAMRVSSPDCSPADRAACASWCDEDPSHAIAFERTRCGLHIVDLHSTTAEIQAMSREILRDTEPRPSTRLRWMAGIAAAILLTIGAGVALQSVSRSPSQLIAEAGEQYETAIGERSTVVLTDGSTVTLNTNSRIDVKFAPDQRDITLMRGQALFEVAKDASRPFVVEVGNQRITALGTAFDVHFDKDGAVKVVLVEGRVAVDELVKSGADSGTAVVPEKRIEMTAGEKLVVSADAARSVEPANIEEATSWRHGRLVFRARPIAEVIAEVNRYSTDQIRLSEDPRFDGVLVSGVFDAGQSESIVVALETMHNVEAQRSARNEITLVWRE